MTTTYLTYPLQDLVSVWHTSVSTRLKCISMPKLIKIYDEVQEFCSFSLKNISTVQNDARQSIVAILHTSEWRIMF